MASVRIDNFSGMRPRASDLRLAISEAIYAQDVDLRKGLLRPRRQQRHWTSGDAVVPMPDGDTPQTLFRFHRRSDETDFWLYWLADVDVVPGPAESDQQRHYYTGDGVPKMFTAQSIDDTTPPYPQSADTKYPYTWYYLGVPAPDVAPDLDTEALPTPSEGSVGLISGVTTPNIIVSVNLDLSTSTALNVHGQAGSDGRTAGLSTAEMRPNGGTQQITCLKPGTRVRVTEIVDADHVKVVASGRTGPIEDMGMIPDSDNWRWDNALPDVHKHTWLTRLNSTAKRKSFFLLPDEVTLEVENHILRVNDIIRITGSSTAMAVTVSQNLVTTPVPSDNGSNYGQRTATLDTADDIEFTGTTSFMIERDGASIDPVVPATAEFETATRSYVYTYVSALGEESAPSPPTDPVTIRTGDAVTITSFTAPPTERRNIDRIWLYRTNTGTDDTAFQFVAEIPVADAAAGYADTVDDEDLGEVLETEGWDVPDESMIGIVSMPNGVLAGFFNNTLCFSEPGFPHAWPAEYRQALDFDIVGIAVYGNALYVTTKGKPYVVVGVHPLQMSARRVETGQPNLDKRSMVNTGDQILYASPEGLISASVNGFVNTTDKHYTKEQWAAVVGEAGADHTIRGWYFDGQYVLDSVTADNETNLIFDFRDDALRITTYSITPIAAFADPESQELFYVLDAAGQPGGTLTNQRKLLRWDFEHLESNPEVDYPRGQYDTGQFRLERPMAFSCARVLCRRVLTAAGNDSAHALVQLTAFGRVYDQWASADAPYDDEIALIEDAAVINGTPGDVGWVGEQAGRPFRLEVNTLVDTLWFNLMLEGPVELEAIILGETMDDLVAT